MSEGKEILDAENIARPEEEIPHYVVKGLSREVNDFKGKRYRQKNRHTVIDSKTGEESNLLGSPTIPKPKV